MTLSLRSLLVAAGLVLAVLSCVEPAAGQLIGLRTVPLAAGEQFSIFPSKHLGMGGPSIALDDPLLDSFVNPAKAGGLDESQFFSAPMSYSISDNNGGARTLPVGVLIEPSPWFGGALVALQGIEEGRRFNEGLPVDPAAGDVVLPSRTGLLDRSATNKYLQGSFGRTLGEGNVAVGLSMFMADLNVTDGVSQLFRNAWAIDEHGGMQDYRLGLTARFGGERTFEAVLVHNRVNMTHEVTSVDWTLTDSAAWLWTPDVGTEVNQNKSRTWGLHVGYVQPLRETGWKVGGILTANRKDHPKIPTYDLVSVRLPERDPIPRDPGHSWAYNFGAGISYDEGPTTFGLDVVYEPASSDTWAEAEAEVLATDGTSIPAGGKTVENRFDFSNASANIGVSHVVDEVAVQFGVRLRHFDYRLAQFDRVELSRRTQTEEWIEWTPSWGFHLTLEHVQLRYTGWASSASHFPFPSFPSGVANSGPVQDEFLDTLAPPAGSLTLPASTVVTHRFAISVPIR